MKSCGNSLATSDLPSELRSYLDTLPPMAKDIILARLSFPKLNLIELADKLGISYATVYHHLRRTVASRNFFKELYRFRAVRILELQELALDSLEDLFRNRNNLPPQTILKAAVSVLQMDPPNFRSEEFAFLDRSWPSPKSE